MDDNPQPPRLYLLLSGAAAPANDERLADLLRTLDVACVLLDAGDGGLTTPVEPDRIGDLQAGGAAVLLAVPASDPANLQGFEASAADGVHLDLSAIDLDPEVALAHYRAARARVGRDGVVGCLVGETRDLAMTLAEEGADYIAFRVDAWVRTESEDVGEDSGQPTRADGDGGEPMPDERMIAWWSDLFQVPVVAWDVTTVAEAGEALEAGADFLALRLPATQSAQSEAFLRAVQGAIDDMSG
ncbi:MAG: hypothetical protein GC150_03925 [Rhizobiales bacterium]|nr:hypothetical protein [Hyphomicrobiales bacterium]